MQTGDIVKSVKWGEAIVLKFGNPRSTVKFLNTGNIYDVSRVALYNGGFSDVVERLRLKEVERELKERIPFKRTRSGVGYVGVGKYSYKEYPEHTVLWASMLRRCYGKNETDYYEDCTVCDRWHNFQNFCEDIQNLPGYSEWVKFEKGEGGRNLYQLDKDTLQEGNRVYSAEACHFITHKENTSYAMKGANSSIYYFVKDNNLFEVKNLKRWCEENGYSDSGFRQLVQGISSSSQGFVMYNPDLDIEDHPKAKISPPRRRSEYYIGKIFDTKKSGKCQVLSFTNKRDVEIVFLDTGYTKKTSTSALLNGTALDNSLTKV